MNYKSELKNINNMAYPILLTYLVTNVFELLDKAIIGHYSIQGFAVVGIAASIIYSITGALGILSVCFTIIAADQKGRQQESGFERAFIVTKTLALFIGLLFLTMSILFGSPFFIHLYDIHDKELEELLSYFYPASLTVLQNILLFQYSAYFRNQLNTKIGLYVTIVSTVVNLFFDYSLVYGAFGMPSLGTAGAAWGSVIGLFCGLLIYQSAYYRRIPPKMVLKQMGDFKDSIQQAKQIIKSYPSLLGQELLENTLFVFAVSSVVSRLGTEKMAVYNLLDTISAVIGLPVYAYATATQTYALQAHSAGKKKSVTAYLQSGIFLAFITILSLCLCCNIFQTSIFHWIIRDEEVIHHAKELLFIPCAVVLIKIPYQIYLSYLQGIGKEKRVFLCTAAGTIAASTSVFICGKLFSLPGIYLVMLLEYSILAWIYKKEIGDIGWQG